MGRGRPADRPDATAPAVTRTASRSKAASTSTGVAAKGGTTTKSSVMSRCTDQQLNWSKLSSSDQQLWSRLGWTQSRWDSDKAPQSESKSWNDLTKTEKRAASQLGFDKRNWDVDCQLTPQKVEPEFDQDDNWSRPRDPTSRATSQVACYLRAGMQGPVTNGRIATDFLPGFR